MPSCSEVFQGRRKYYVLLVLCIVIVAIVTLSITLTVKGKEDPKPNVVLIIADDMGYNDIGYYNQDGDIRTPFLDKLARTGLRLDNYYGQSICTPARAALFTGRYPFRYGLQGARPILYGAKTGLPLSEDHLLPQIMAEGGYKTALVGKWHLGYSRWDYTPLRRGFEKFTGMYGGFADYFTHQMAESETPGFKGFDLHNHTLTAGGEIEETATDNMDLIQETYGVFSEKLFTDKAVEIVENHDTRDPLFLTVSYMNPHSPLQPLSEDLAKVPANITNEIRRKFSALMSSLDAGVQQITESLRARGILDNSLIIFTGDNGGAIQGPGPRSAWLGGSNFPLRGSKWTIWEGGVKVPAFVWGAGITPGSVSQQLFHITDWVPTLARVARVKPKKELDGVDQLDILYGTATEETRSDLILELDPCYNQAAYISNNFKLIVGDASPKPYDGIYRPIEKEGEDWYFGNQSRSMYADVSTVLREKESEFMERMKKEGHFYRNISEVGGFSTDNVMLFDLWSDPAEKFDLFNESSRFESVARTMYGVLAKEIMTIAEPVFYTHSNKLTREELEAGIGTNTYTFSEGEIVYEGTDVTEVLKWHPWLPDSV